MWTAQTFLVFLTHHRCIKSGSLSSPGVVGCHSAARASPLLAGPLPVPPPGSSRLQGLPCMLCFIFSGKNLLRVLSRGLQVSGLGTAGTFLRRSCEIGGWGCREAGAGESLRPPMTLSEPTAPPLNAPPLVCVVSVLCLAPEQARSGSPPAAPPSAPSLQPGAQRARETC